MQKLKLGVLEDDRPVKLTIELPAAVHRDLIAYAQAFSQELNQSAPDPAKLIPPMVARFMASDRAFVKRRKTQASPTVRD